MLIVCPNCGTSYRVNPESLGESGRSVRCAACHEVWFEEPRELAGQGAVVGSEAFPPLIRPPLDDVVDIGAIQAEPHSHEETAPWSEREAALATEALPSEDAPSVVPAANPATDRATIDAARTIEHAAARTTARPLKIRPRLSLSQHALPVAIGTLCLLLVCLIAARQQVVRMLPQTASLYASIGLPVNLRGLAFENIKTARDTVDGVPMLIVEGEIVGTTGRHTEVPRLRFAVTDNLGREIYAWTARPERSLLPPGETLPFRSRLASPPAEASGITVRFFNRRDAQTGMM